MKSQLKDLQDSILMLLRLQRYKNRDSGYILVVVVVAMVLTVPAILATYALMSKVDSSVSDASARSNTGFYAAEAGLNLRAKEVRDLFKGYNRPGGISPAKWEDCHDPDANHGSADANDDDKNDFACDTSLTFQGLNVTTFVRDLNDRDDDDRPAPASITIPPGEPFAGLTAQEYRYEVVSVARDREGLPTANVTMRFKSRLVPLFQFVVFYDNDADFTNPPNMTLHGPVHSNNNLYLNAGASTASICPSTGVCTLTIDGPISVAGTLYRGEKATDSCGSTVTIYDDNHNARNLSCNASSRTPYSESTDSPSDIDDWGDQIRFLTDPLTVPPPDALDVGESYWDKADLRIALKLDLVTGNPSPTASPIEVRNQDETINATATNNLLNSCSTAPSLTLRNDSGDGTTFYERTRTTLRFNNPPNANSVAAGTWRVGESIRIYDANRDDSDSNVIAGPDTVITAGLVDLNGANSGDGWVDPGNTITLRRQMGHSYQVPSAAASFFAPGATVRKAIVSTSNTFYNYREKNGVAGGAAGREIRMLNVDAQGLLNCARLQDLMDGKELNDETDGGLAWFLTVDGPNSTGSSNNYGVRVYNGAALTGGGGLPADDDVQGLTMVSDQAAYVQGNYNSTNKKPASFIADTINVLSNAWRLDDSNGRGYSAAGLPSTTINFDSRTPTETTVNAAFLAGTGITGDANGATGHRAPSSGGVNNYPRFHEHWNGTVRFNYRGSFVSLNSPRHVNSAFCGSYDAANCNIYSPPNRNWDFDTDFNNAGNLPPLSPQAVYLRQEFFSRDFERASIKLWPSPLSMSPLNFFGLLHPPLNQQ